MEEPLISVYEWRYADEAGVTADGPAIAFESQELAEQWLAENHQQLTDDGVSAVSLFDGTAIVYGPMPVSS
ncbi:MAG: hypothetical protein M3Z00_10380 [Actinomycetota bacterium]|nr:hypothetical protein [Actinomycetota bacterium]